jgi:hypothetical protein
VPVLQAQVVLAVLRVLQATQGIQVQLVTVDPVVLLETTVILATLVGRVLVVQPVIQVTQEIQATMETMVLVDQQALEYPEAAVVSMVLVDG